MTKGWGSIRFCAAQPGIAAALLPRPLIGTERRIRGSIGFERTISPSHVGGKSHSASHFRNASHALSFSA
jgi:hypothetical protein